MQVRYAGGSKKGFIVNRNCRWAFPIALSLVLAATLEAQGALDGKVLFESRCTNCHDVKILLAMKKRRKQWNDTIVDMRRIGAKMSDIEASAIVNYLLKTAGR